MIRSSLMNNRSLEIYLHEDEYVIALGLLKNNQYFCCNNYQRRPVEIIQFHDFKYLDCDPNFTVTTGKCKLARWFHGTGNSLIICG